MREDYRVYIYYMFDREKITVLPSWGANETSDDLSASPTQPYGDQRSTVNRRYRYKSDDKAYFAVARGRNASATASLDTSRTATIFFRGLEPNFSPLRDQVESPIGRHLITATVEYALAR
jgi:hypothetical protein